MPQWEQEYIAPRLKDYELVFASKEDYTKDSNIEIISNFIGFPVSGEIMSKFPKLKYVATRSTGFDHIDIKAAAQKNILVSNVPTYGENTVAEYAFALLLALSRKIYPSVKQVREKGLFENSGLEGFDLRGKVFGVVGTGHIGERAARMALGFEMKVVAYDPHPKTELTEKYGLEYMSLEDLLKKSDIISLHVPYLPSTHHLINSKNIGLCKKEAIIINTARGGLIETEALTNALKAGTLGGAGLDVLEEEGFVKEELHLINEHPNSDQIKIALADHELMEMDNVLITPHNAFNSREALKRILDTTAENILSFIKGQPQNLVKA